MPGTDVSTSSGKLAGRRRCTADGCRRLAPHGETWCDDHHPLRDPAGHVRRSPVLGRIEPRLWTPPLRPLTRETTRGYEANEFARMIGEPNLEWQEWLNVHALELLPVGTYRFRIVLVLVARQNGKSTVKRKVSLWRLYLDGARCILGTAQDVALAREQMNLAKASIFASPDLADEYGGDRSVNGDEQFWLWPPGTRPGTPKEALPRYVIRATNRRAGRGLASIAELNIDELREQRDWFAWAALSKTVMAQPHAQIWVMSNAGDDASVVLNQLRSAAGVSVGSDGVSVLGEARDPSIGIFEYSAPEGCELDDWDAIAQANPALNRGGPSTAAIETALGSDPPEVYRTEVLCQGVPALDSAIDQVAWKDCRDITGSLSWLRDRVAVVVDVSPDSAHVTMTASALTADGRPRVEVVQAWTGTQDAYDDLDVLLDRVRPVVVGWFPSGPGGVFAPILRPADLKAEEKLPSGWRTSHKHRGRAYVELTGTRVTEACQGFADLVATRRVLHPDDPLLNNHVAGATKLPSGDGWRFTRNGVGHVDATYAAAGAATLAQMIPAQARPNIRVMSA